MMNYMKSEVYRITHSKTIYGFTIFFVLLSLLMNGIFGWYRSIDVNFLYRTTSFSYSFIVGSPMSFCFLASILTTLLYDGNRKNGNLKNTVAFGISRIKIVTGMSIVTIFFATIVMSIILSVYVSSAQLLLEQAGVVSVYDILTEVVAVYFIAIASIISTLFFLEILSKSGMAIFIWILVWLVIPDALIYMTIRVEWLHQLILLLPNNLFDQMSVNMTESKVVWETSRGMLKCIIIGIAHLVLLYGVSIVFLRRKDI